MRRQNQMTKHQEKKTNNPRKRPIGDPDIGIIINRLSIQESHD